MAINNFRNLLEINSVPENCTFEQVEARIVEAAGEVTDYDKIVMDDISYQNFIASPNTAMLVKLTKLYSEYLGRRVHIINAFRNLFLLYKANFPALVGTGFDGITPSLRATEYSDLRYTFDREVGGLVSITSLMGGTISNTSISGNAVIFDFTTPNTPGTFLTIVVTNLTGKISSQKVIITLSEA